VIVEKTNNVSCHISKKKYLLSNVKNNGPH